MKGEQSSNIRERPVVFGQKRGKIDVGQSVMVNTICRYSNQIHPFLAKKSAGSFRFWPLSKMFSPSYYACACTVGKVPTCFYQVHNFNAIKSTATAWMLTRPYPAVLRDTWVSHVSLSWLPHFPGTSCKEQLFLQTIVHVKHTFYKT